MDKSTVSRLNTLFGEHVFSTKDVNNKNAQLLCIFNCKDDTIAVEFINDINGRMATMKLVYDGGQIDIINIYAPSKTEEKSDFLTQISGKLATTQGAWLAMGDFNVNSEAKAPDKATEIKMAKDWRNLLKEKKWSDVHLNSKYGELQHTRTHAPTGRRARLDW